MMESIRKAATSLCVVGMLAFASDAGAEAAACERPDMPEIPDGTTVSEAELEVSGREIRAFIADSQAFLACLEANEAAYGEDITPARKSLIDAIYNAAVDAMQAAANGYNAALRDFDARGES